MKGLAHYLSFRFIYLFSAFNPLLDWIESKFKKPERWQAPKEKMVTYAKGFDPKNRKREDAGKWIAESNIKVGILSGNKSI